MKNLFYLFGNKELYRIYRNKIFNILCELKKIYFYKFFFDNLYNMKLIWVGINDLINCGKKKFRCFFFVRCLISGNLIYDFKEIINVFNKYFFFVGYRFVFNLLLFNCYFSEYLCGNYEKLFFFDLVILIEIEREIFFIFFNKVYGLYFCLNCIFCFVRYILFYLLVKLMNLLVILGEYFFKLKYVKVILVYKDDDEIDLVNYRLIFLLFNYNCIFEKIMFN